MIVVPKAPPPVLDDIELAEGSGGPREANPLKRSDASVSTKGWRR
jgi:hypothetical protein